MESREQHNLASTHKTIVDNNGMIPVDSVVQDNVSKGIIQFAKDYGIKYQTPGGGVCHPLSLLHIQYSLKGKSDEFYKCLKALSTYPAKKKPTDQAILQEFVKEMSKIQNLSVLGSDQVNAYRQIGLTSQYLESSFFTRNDLIKLFKTIDLNEMGMSLSVIRSKKNNPNIIEGHTIDIEQVDGTYTLYDSNNLDGPIQIKNIEELVDTIIKACFMNKDKVDDVMPFYLNIYGDKKNAEMSNLNDFKDDRLNHYAGRIITSNNMSQVYWASRNNDADTLASLLKLESEKKMINQPSLEYKASPLLYTVYHRNLESSRLLLKNGADFCLADSIGNSSLYIALINKDKEVLNAMFSANTEIFRKQLVKDISKYYDTCAKNYRKAMGQESNFSELAGGSSTLFKDIDKGKTAKEDFLKIVQSSLNYLDNKTANELLNNLEEMEDESKFLKDSPKSSIFNVIMRKSNSWSDLHKMLSGVKDDLTSKYRT